MVVGYEREEYARPLGSKRREERMEECQAAIGAGETAYGSKLKWCMWFSESRWKEPNKCMVE